MNFDRLTNEELDALAATEIMGWHRFVDSFGTEYWQEAEAPTMAVMRVNLWQPTGEGKEGQAFMVADKMFQDGWGWEFGSPIPGEVVDPDNPCVMRFWKSPTKLAADDIDAFAEDSARGRAIIVAALKAKEQEVSGALLGHCS